MGYISSNANRWYCAQESAYGQVPSITAENRIPAVKLTARQQREKSQRKDKTGSRTWAGMPSGMRRQTTFDLTSYMRDWPDMGVLPPHGPLFEAALGGPGVLWAGGTVAPGSDAVAIKFSTPHNLAPGQAITCAGEIRFVSAIADAQTVLMNAPFSVAPVAGISIGATAIYNLAEDLPSVSVFDYWDPQTAAQRILSGTAVDRLSIALNGDFHQFEFKGQAQDLIDSTSFTSGQGGATAFPPEPASANYSYSPVPGHLGQVWLGVIPNRFFTVAQASIEVRNNLNLRTHEFGSILPRGIVAGDREVLMNMELFSQDDEATTALYQAARQQSPISVMFQMGQINGQLLGIYLKSLVPEVPVFDDTDHRLKWKFSDIRAQGTANDEVVVAFG
jgi:hypothetical protein